MLVTFEEISSAIPAHGVAPVRGRAEGSLKSLVVQRAQVPSFAEYRGVYMRPEIAQVLYSEIILLPFLPNLWSNANTKKGTQ